MPFFRFAVWVMVIMFSSTLMLTLSATADTVTGTAIYRERIMPPPDARFVAVLSDISRTDAPAIELGRFEIEAAGPPPYAFEIDYDAAKIDDGHTYAVRATLWSGDQLMFTTDTVNPVLTRGAPDTVETTMVRVAKAQPEAATDQGQIGAHGLRLPATFTGVLPCADCEGIRYHLDLWADQGYHLRREWLGTDGMTQDNVGHWYSDPQRDAIVLSGLSDTPTHWQVKAPDRIRQLDMDDNVIVSDLPYDLTSTGTLDKTDIKDVFLGGMMTYMADAAVFQECRTGRSYPIVHDGDYAALERAYLEDQSAPAALLYVNVEGDLLMRHAMEGPDQRSLVVNRFVRTRPGITCERQRADAALTNTYWRIDALAGEEITASPDGNREPHLILRTGDENRYTATAGCNAMMGGYTLNGDMLTFTQGAATLMACPPPLQNLEQALAQALTAVRRYRINGETLVLYNEMDEMVGLMTAVYLR